jgi:hypothetical protein
MIRLLLLPVLVLLALLLVLWLLVLLPLMLILQTGQALVTVICLVILCGVLVVGLTQSTSIVVHQKQQLLAMVPMPQHQEQQGGW